MDNKELAKRLPKLDEYDLEWVRHALNVKAVEINQMKSLVVMLLEKVEKVEADLHRCLVQRQADMVKMADVCMEREDIKRVNAALVERVAKCESRLNKASELLASIRKDEADKRSAEL